MSATCHGVPVPKAGPAFEIVRLKAAQTLEGIFLSDFPWGYLTHWIERGKKGFSVECKKGVAQCRCDTEELPTRWKGYLHVWDIRRNRECFLEITPYVFESMKGWVPSGEDYRGLKFKASRSKGADNGRLTIVIGSPYQRQDRDALPPARDPRPFLEALWNLVGHGPVSARDEE